MSELIDTTEMYLRTVFELEEEGVPPLRARIAERLQQSGPTVSQTVQRMERDGLLTVAADRRIELTDEGRRRATSVMRKHRLAEVLLTEMIGLPIELVHDEACRWEHVISDVVEERLGEILGNPTRSPYGNPIPREAVVPDAPAQLHLATLDAVLRGRSEAEVVIERIGEALQSDAALMGLLAGAGVRPGAVVRAVRTPDRLELAASGHCAVEPDAAAHLFVRAV